MLIIAISSATAQSLPLSLDDKYGDNPAGTYFSDIENEMEKFVGTWQYLVGNESLTIVL